MGSLICILCGTRITVSSRSALICLLLLLAAVRETETVSIQSLQRRRAFLSSIVVAISLFGSSSSSSSSAAAAAAAAAAQEQAYDAFASSYDRLDGNSKVADTLGISSLRKQAALVSKGDVLEVAIGTGLQADYYDWSQIISYTGIDQSQGMLDMAASKFGAAGIPSLSLTKQDASSMTAFKDDSFDTVVDTFAFCVFTELDKVLSEMIRVVKPNGRIVLLENSVSTNPFLKVLQDVSEPLITPLSKSCRWNVNVPLLAEQAGLKQTSSQSTAAGTLFLGTYTK